MRHPVLLYINKHIVDTDEKGRTMKIHLHTGHCCLNISVAGKVHFLPWPI